MLLCSVSIIGTISFPSYYNRKLGYKNHAMYITLLENSLLTGNLHGIFILEAGRKLLRKYDIQVLKTSTGIFYSKSIAVYIRKLHKWSPVLNHTILEFAYNVTLVQAQKV